MSRRKLKRLARPAFWRRVGQWSARQVARAFFPFGLYLAMVLSLALLPGMVVQTQAAKPEITVYSATFTPIPAHMTKYEPTPVPCVDRAEFVEDVNFPDGAQVHRGTAFRKSWRVRNVGNCAWTYFGVTYAQGDQLNGTMYADYPTNVAPGDEAIVSLILVAPGETGHYRGAWLLITGRQAWSDGLPLWVDIYSVENTQGDCYAQLDALPIKSRWAAIVAGEAIDAGADGMRLVAWTMQAQAVYWQRDPALFGPRYGWYGCRSGGEIDMALPYVEEAFGQDPASAPYDFMRAGGMCSHLGSYDDQMKWMAEGKYGTPADFVAGYGVHAVYCFFEGFRKSP